MFNAVKEISKIRDFLNKENLDFFLVKYTDEFLSEYVKLETNSRYLITGFTGSTGDALVAKDKIYLFVDGRYHIQAEDETNPEFVEVVKLDLNTTELKATLDIIYSCPDKNIRIGIPSAKTSVYYYNKFVEELKKLDKNIDIVEYPHDPNHVHLVSEQGKRNLFYVYPEIAGILTEEKIVDIETELKKQDIDVFLITKLEEIAYLSNLRSFDNPYNSTFPAMALIYNYKCFIFTDLHAISDEITDKFSKNIEYKSFEQFEAILEQVHDDLSVKSIGYDETSINLFNYRKLQNSGKRLININPNPVSQMKSIKNYYELNHFREMFLKTDIVVTRAIQTLNQKLESGEKVTEKDFSDIVKNLFQQEGAKSLSFEPITASGTNSAIIHYSNPDNKKEIRIGDLVLLDCGGYFEGGYATDITRTFIAGGKKALVDKKTKKIYTQVLKAFLNGLNYPLTEDTGGFDIDKTVRDIINQNMEEGFTFPHGTGHGVGISVHELPPRIGTSELSKTPLKEGMCFTIEPGLYCEDWGGVRLENTVVLVKENNKLKIKSLSKCGFDENLIDYSLLNENEKEWLKSYNYGIIGK